jgi:hypothetical protein
MTDMEDENIIAKVAVALATWGRSTECKHFENM